MVNFTNNKVDHITTDDVHDAMTDLRGTLICAHIDKELELELFPIFIVKIRLKNIYSTKIN